MKKLSLYATQAPPPAPAAMMFLWTLFVVGVATTTQAQQQQPYPPPDHPKYRLSTATIDPYFSSPTFSGGRYHSPPPTQRRRRRRRAQQEGDESDTDGPPDISHESHLRSALLENYDRNAFPYEKVWEQQEASGQTRTGMNVEFSLNFHKVHALNVAESTAHLVVWVQERWKDPRLTWDPLLFNNVTKTWFYIEDGMGGGEVSEIWTPDIYLWNQEESMDVSLANSECVTATIGGSAP
jgi:hypothetical protein